MPVWEGRDNDRSTGQHAGAAASSAGMPVGKRTLVEAAQDGAPARPSASSGADASDPVNRGDEQKQGSNVDRLITLLRQPSGPLGWEMGYAFLGDLGMTELLATVAAIGDRGYLPQLDARAHAYAGAPYLRARLLAAVHVVQLAATPVGVADQRLKLAGAEVDQLPQADQLRLVEFLLSRAGVTIASTTLLEGVLALREQRDAQGGPGTPTAKGAGTAGATSAAAGVTGAANPPAPIEPGPWAPPGDQPIPLYIGNEAHKGIAEEYRAAHLADMVMTNYRPISSILAALQALGNPAKPNALNEEELGLVPDIANLTRLHMYEIKPLAAQALGAAKARRCVAAFGRAGVTMQLGSTSEPGTQGALPAPAGVYMFWSPEPGVIVYQYRHGRLVPVPVPAAEPATERRWRFELQPLTPQQRQAVVTVTVGTALLIAAMILLSPVGI